MKYYLFSESGFEFGSYATFADAYEAMTSFIRFGGSDDLFISTVANPWA